MKDLIQKLLLQIEPFADVKDGQWFIDELNNAGYSILNVGRDLTMKSMGTPHRAIGEICIIRCYASGVHIGTVLSIENGAMFSRVTLSQSRRIRYWYGARSLSELAIDGLDSSKSQIHNPLPIHYIEDAIEIIPASKKCINTVRNTTNESK